MSEPPLDPRLQAAAAEYLENQNRRIALQRKYGRWVLVVFVALVGGSFAWYVHESRQMAADHDRKVEQMHEEYQDRVNKMHEDSARWQQEHLPPQPPSAPR